MKLISINIRGVRGSIKNNYLRELIHKEHADLVCLHETKCKEMGQEKNFKMWGTNKVEWVVNKNDNGEGGVITMWKRNHFLLSNITNGSNYNILGGE